MGDPRRRRRERGSCSGHGAYLPLEGRAIAYELATRTVPPSPGRGGRGGLRPPFFAPRTPMRSIGCGAKRAGWGELHGNVVFAARCGHPTPPRPPSLRSAGDPPPAGEGDARCTVQASNAITLLSGGGSALVVSRGRRSISPG